MNVRRPRFQFSQRRRDRRRSMLPVAVESLEDRRLLTTAGAGLEPLSASGLVVAVNEYDTSRVLVQLRDGFNTADVATVFGDAEFTRSSRTVPGMFEVAVDGLSSVEQTIATYRAHASVVLAEPNYRIQLTSLSPPNDPRYEDLWGLNNTSQSGGKSDADIDALEAWTVTAGASSTIVAVIDTGVDYAHEDLAANMWFNSGEIPWNGVDDDGNGFVDDVHGYDFVNNDGDPSDDNGHGTHVAGTIAAVGDNGIGIVGVAPGVRIMALKFLSASGSGYVSDAVRALDYAVAMGASISNNSWGGGLWSSALTNAITNAQSAGHIFVAAAGNRGSNNDYYGTYPATYSNANIVAVAATDHNDVRASFSNYGATTVDVAAPGVGILSTLPGNRYGQYNGTSMAAPHVSGVLALVRSRHPEWSFQQTIDQVLNTVDPLSSLTGRVKSGGRINAARALGMNIPYPDLHGDDGAHATAVAAGSITNGRINEVGDEDWFGISMTAGRTYLLETGLGTLADSTLTLYDTDGTTMLRFDDDGGVGSSSHIQFTSTITGNYFLRVLADGAFTGTYALQTLRITTVGTPTINGPSSGDVDTTPTIVWSTAKGTDHYELLVYDVVAGKLVVNRPNVSATSFTVTSGLAAGRRYEAWARGVSGAGEIGAWSSGHAFTIALPDRPTLSGPGSWTTDTKPRISWTAVAGADHYELMMFSATTGRLVHQSSHLAATNFTPPSNLPVWQRYQVWARSVNVRGEAGAWSAPLSFAVASPAPPVLAAPGASTSDKTPSVTWAVSQGAAHYDLLVYDVHAGRLVAMADDFAATSYTISTKLPVGTTYQVWLRATNSAGDAGTWGVPTSFTVAAPFAPTIVAPAASTSDASPTIRWTASSNAASYELLVYNLGVGAVVRHEMGITTTQFTPPSALSAGATFQAFVRAANADGEYGAWSVPYRFSTTTNAAGFVSLTSASWTESIAESADTDSVSSARQNSQMSSAFAMTFDAEFAVAHRDDARFAETGIPVARNKHLAPAQLPPASIEFDRASNDHFDSENRIDDGENAMEGDFDSAGLLDALFGDPGFDLTLSLI